jgi:hypothetical protein
MDLTKTENQIEFAKYFYKYIDKIELPKEVKDEIYRQEDIYNKGMITNSERFNMTLDTIHAFIKSLI